MRIQNVLLTVIAAIAGIFILLVGLCIQGYGQAKQNKLKTLSISIPIIWNKSEATYYTLGSPKHPSGNAISYGINVNHSRIIHKNLFMIIGLGYFKQQFGIKRPFHYDSPLAFLFFTDSYKYDNADFYAGIGYKLNISEVVALKGHLAYHHLYSFRQKYINHSETSDQINRKGMTIGRMINLNLGIERNITKNISLELDAALPVSMHWNNDEIFVKYDYSGDTQKIGHNKFSIGTVISCNYHF